MQPRKKMTALATIGKELGKVINLDGVELVVAPTRAVRNVFCQYCKRTLTRVCNQAVCKLKAQGGAAPTTTKKRKSGKEEWNSDDDESDADTSVIDSDNESNASDVPEAITVDDLKPWVKDPRGKLAIGRYFNAMLLTDDPTHDRIPAKVTRYYLHEKKFNMLELKLFSPELTWEYEMSSVEEVYEAIKASASIIFASTSLELRNPSADSFTM
jgi:hypothetical protein